MNQSELAQIAGVTDKAVSTWENDLKIPRMGAIQKIADYFHISKSAIIEDESQNPLPIYPFPGILPIRGHRPVPIIGNAACGQPIYKPSDGTDFIDAGPEIAPCDFALIADGDSMIGDRIHDGDVVFIRQQNDADDGSIVAVAVDDEMMLNIFRASKRLMVQLFIQSLLAPIPNMRPSVSAAKTKLETSIFSAKPLLLEAYFNTTKDYTIGGNTDVGFFLYIRFHSRNYFSRYQDAFSQKRTQRATRKRRI